MHDRNLLDFHTCGPTGNKTVCIVADAVSAPDLSNFRIMQLVQKCSSCNTYYLDGDYFNARQHRKDTALMLTEHQFLHHCSPSIRGNTDRFILTSQLFEQNKKMIERKFSNQEGFSITKVSDRVVIDAEALVK